MIHLLIIFFTCRGVYGVELQGIIPEVVKDPLAKVTNHTITLRFGKGASQLTEIDCVESMFMSPFHLPVALSANSTYVGSRHDKHCHWNFIGTEPCIPALSCSTFNLDCDKESLIVTDGYKGYETFCGTKIPQKIIAGSDLRDIYLEFKSNPGASGSFSCNMECTARGDKHVKPLPPTRDEKTDGKCFCGDKGKDDRIVGGVNATKSEFPWLVALVEAETRQPFCGGSLINDRVILTAGHCFKGKFLDINNVEILANAHFLDSMPNLLVSKVNQMKYDKAMLEKLDSGNGSRRYYPHEIFVHPLYVAETNDFDFAAIVLRTPVQFDHLVRPICLPDLGSYMRNYAHKKATVAGWGLQGIESEGTPNTLQKVGVNVFSPSECKKMYAHRVNRRMLCSGWRDGGMDSCSGDSGGPLIVEDKPKVWVQIGSVSWGDGCAKSENPGVYFRTTESGQYLHHISNSNGAVWCKSPE